MTDDFTASDDPSTVGKVLEGVQDTAHKIGDAVTNARRPGMPLDLLADGVRQAPLASLAVAFMLGVAFARRR